MSTAMKHFRMTAPIAKPCPNGPNPEKSPNFLKLEGPHDYSSLKA
jgi:hypothetical protein